MIYYAIRQKTTGYFLPQPVVHEPATSLKFCPLSARVPRLALTKSRAKVILKLWLLVNKFEENDPKQCIEIISINFGEK